MAVSSAAYFVKTAQICLGPLCHTPSRPHSASLSPLRCMQVYQKSGHVERPGACSKQSDLLKAPSSLQTSFAIRQHFEFPMQARRSVIVRASENANAEDLDAQREELKSKLRRSLEGNTGNLTEEELRLIDELAKLNPDPQPAKNLNLVKGGFRLLNSTTPGVLYKGAKLTLGRGSFWMFPPSEMMMTLHDVYNEVNEADGRQYYDIYEDVTLEPEGLPTLRATIYNKAVYTLEGDIRVAVEFTESVLSPKEGTDLEVWKKVFKENPDMEEDGTMRKKFPKGKPGWLDIIYQDKSFRITKGNLGNIVVVERDP